MSEGAVLFSEHYRQHHRRPYIVYLRATPRLATYQVRCVDPDGTGSGWLSGITASTLIGMGRRTDLADSVQRRSNVSLAASVHTRCGCVRSTYQPVRRHLTLDSVMPAHAGRDGA
jgi:hypothetical protein